MAQFTPETARQWARVGGKARAAKHDPSELSRQGQRGLAAKFAREIDPDGLLDPEERTLRAKRMLSAHMLRLNILRTQKRQRARAAAAAPVAVGATTT